MSLRGSFFVCVYIGSGLSLPLLYSDQSKKHLLFAGKRRKKTIHFLVFEKKASADAYSIKHKTIKRRKKTKKPLSDATLRYRTEAKKSMYKDKPSHSNKRRRREKTEGKEGMTKKALFPPLLMWEREASLRTVSRCVYPQIGSVKYVQSTLFFYVLGSSFEFFFLRNPCACVSQKSFQQRYFSSSVAVWSIGVILLFSLSLSVSQNLQHVAPVEGVCGRRGGGRADRRRNRATLVAAYGLARRNPVAVCDRHHVGG